MNNLLADYARLLRLPGLAGLSIAPVFGAISLMGSDIAVRFQDLVILFVIGAFSAIYGFVLNDYADVDIDKLSKELFTRPLVKGTISKRTALAICILCVIGAFTAIYVFLYNTYPSFYYGVGCIILSAILGTIYNFYGKRFIGSDILVALSEAFLVLFGAFMIVQDGMLNIYTWIIFILTFNQLVYMNAVEGGLKDADHDYLKNVKNIALASGVKVTKNKKFVIPTSFRIFGIGIRLFSASLVFVPFAFYGEPSEPWHLILLLIFVIGVLYLSEKLLNLKKFERNKIRKLITMQTFMRYSLVPLMLIPTIGIVYAVLLIIFPFAWYIIFTPLIGEKLFRPRL